ncbi:MAG: hypothetical protein Q9220_004663 [cf. Caloplaca sp. 1 TL-2023]
MVPFNGHMARSAFECSIAIHAVVPHFTPKPIAWGPCIHYVNYHYCLSEARVMEDKLPDPHAFTKDLAALHQLSESPEGKFGFHVTTFKGDMPHAEGWDWSWERYFAKSLKRDFVLQFGSQGFDPEILDSAPALFSRVIPRLLRPLQSGGRSIKPCLVHGNLEYANQGTDPYTGQCLVLGPCSFYAHNEYEFGPWRLQDSRFGPEYLEAYHSHVPKSPPEEDYEGRLDLYELCVCGKRCDETPAHPL